MQIVLHFGIAVYLQHSESVIQGGFDMIDTSAHSHS